MWDHRISWRGERSKCVFLSFWFQDLYLFFLLCLYFSNPDSPFFLPPVCICYWLMILSYWQWILYYLLVRTVDDNTLGPKCIMFVLTMLAWPLTMIIALISRCRLAISLLLRASLISIDLIATFKGTSIMQTPMSVVDLLHCWYD